MLCRSRLELSVCVCVCVLEEFWCRVFAAHVPARRGWRCPVPAGHGWLRPSLSGRTGVPREAGGSPGWCCISSHSVMLTEGCVGAPARQGLCKARRASAQLVPVPESLGQVTAPVVPVSGLGSEQDPPGWAQLMWALWRSRAFGALSSGGGRTIPGSSRKHPWLSLLVCSAVHLPLLLDPRHILCSVCGALSVVWSVLALCPGRGLGAGFGSQVCWLVAPKYGDT